MSSSSPHPDPRRLAPLLTSGNDSLTNLPSPRSPHSRHTSHDFLAVNAASHPPSPQNLPSPNSNDVNRLRRKPLSPNHSPHPSLGSDSRNSPYASPYLHPVDHRSLTPLDASPLPQMPALEATRRTSITADGVGAKSREGSRSRPTTPGGTENTSGSDSMPSSPKLRKAAKRKSWFSKSGPAHGDGVDRQTPPAWIAGHFDNVAYNLLPLINGERVSDEFAPPQFSLLLAYNMCIGFRIVERRRRYARTFVPTRIWQKCFI